MKAVLRTGDISAAMCPHCRHIVQIRYETRSVQLRGNRVIVPDVLVGVCVECDHTAQIPRQSLPQLRQLGAA